MMFNVLAILGFLAALSFRIAHAAQISVSSDDPKIFVDQHWKYDDITPGCNVTWWTETKDSEASFNFTGTGVSIIGGRNVRGGIYDVYIDERMVGSVDRYGANVNRTCGIVMFEEPTLTLGLHSLRIVLRANSTQASKDRTGVLEFSEIRYTIPDDVLNSMTGSPFGESSATTSSLLTNTIFAPTSIAVSRTPIPTPSTVPTGSALRIGDQIMGIGSLVMLLSPLLLGILFV
ncbi:hypothetical protein FRC02_005244 [Tulasnella sp. 418]|nr:hypothetical protein FRC02_005244 [Tulasnella sp. 418]